MVGFFLKKHPHHRKIISGMNYDVIQCMIVKLMKTVFPDGFFFEKHSISTSVIKKVKFFLKKTK